ncbi:hypothetical protein TBLA_0D03660 [Henningerozyma blattae CBS 6284]|uniref:Uncharacterized protein n=1 Tax=Henningerozyma blattae (strain ATCC 34711 / CBS 6284 / DSM 70876 / NBRC 10599 / NRRL Y-10934 / UCD 77-7) TaxID=1071380 RepID=I2H3B3_HENB6|nr:hypothetical protein TBLA_0D03660 [Tetrapisispora blattae CBS 6284]CCH60865.1 hypothetical protein TBLA_0D03660 [Tetrapisispora blattae CBS 6284]
MEFNDPSILTAVRSSERNSNSNSTNNGRQTSQTATADHINKFFQDLKRKHEKKTNEDSKNSTNNDYDNDDFSNSNANSLSKLLKNKNSADRNTSFDTPKSTFGNDISNDTSDKQPFTLDFKPVAEKKSHVYSVNELLAISEDLDKDLIDGIVSKLPNKKFWRLQRKYPDHNNNNSNNNNSTNSGKSSGYRSQLSNNSNSTSNNGPNINSLGNAYSNDQDMHGRRNSRSKNTRLPRSKRGGLNKFGKERNYNEDKHNNEMNTDDLMELEKEFEPTGNSMADFEMWKAKMKETENRKKGISSTTSSSVSSTIINSSISQKDDLGNTSSSVDRPNLTGRTTSSISDFLKMNTEKESKTKSDSADESKTEPLGSSSLSNNESKKTRSNFVKNDVEEGAVGTSSSRFSSFFTNSSLSTSGNSPSKSNIPINEQANQERSVSNYNSNRLAQPAESVQTLQSGSKLMSFFKTDSRSSTPQTPGTPLSNTPIARTENITPFMQGPTSIPQMQHQLPQQQQQHQQQQQQIPHAQQCMQQIPPQMQQQLQQQMRQQQHPPFMQHTMGQVPNNNAFFQNLLNKGKDKDGNDTPMAPPPGLIPPLQNGKQQFPPNISVPPGFPMPMPPQMMHPQAFMGFQGQPQLQSNMLMNSSMPNISNNKDSNKSKGKKFTNNEGIQEKKNSQNILRQNSNSTIPDNGSNSAGNTIPPQFMPGMLPPGFPPMQGMPPNNMMPPQMVGNQPFFPGIPPPNMQQGGNRYPPQVPTPIENIEQKSKK